MTSTGTSTHGTNRGPRLAPWKTSKWCCGTGNDSGKFAEHVYREEWQKHSEVLTNASSLPALVVHPDDTALVKMFLPVEPGLMASTVKINNAIADAKTQLGLLLSECGSVAGTA